MASHRQFFSFTKKQVDYAFARARTVASRSGLKLLRLQKEQLLTPLGEGKLLVIIPRAAGKAHDRNLIRRRLKAIFYQEKLYGYPLTYFILVYHQAKQLSFEELKTFLCSYIKK